MSADFSAAISKATEVLAAKDTARRDFEVSHLELQRLEEEQLQMVKDVATKFQHQKLEPLLRDLQHKLGEQGYSVHGEFLGERLIARIVAGPESALQTSILYDKSSITIRVNAQGSGAPQAQVYTPDQFDQDEAANTVTAQIVAMLGPWLESGSVQRFKPIRPK